MRDICIGCVHNLRMSTANQNPCFVLELALRVDSAGRRRLARDFDFGRQLVNATLGTALGYRTQMIQTPEWKAACAMPKDSERTKAFRELSRTWRVSSAYDFEKILQEHANASGRGKQLHSDIKQVLADNLWNAWSAWLFDGKGKPRFKGRSRGLHSLRGKKNSTGISWLPELQSVRYGGTQYRVHVPKKDAYAREAMRDNDGWRKAKYCAIVRKTIRGKLKYFVQITFAGNPPAKIVPADKDVSVGIDPSMQNMTLAFTNGVVAKVKTGPGVSNSDKEIRRLQRAMDRSRRANNPQNYNSDGTVKKGTKVWLQSKSYQQLRHTVADILRRKTEARKNDHGRLINLIVQSAGDIRIEKNSWKAMQRNRYGKSVGNGAPGEFVERLLNKAERAGSKAVLIEPWKIKPSQQDLLTGNFHKHELWERRIRIDGTNYFVDRDVQASLNVLHYSPETERRDAEGLKHILETSKQYWLDAGILVEIKAANRLSEREFRRVLRHGLEPVAVEQLHPHSFLNDVCDVESKKEPSGTGRDSKSPPKSETSLLQ